MAVCCRESGENVGGGENDLLSRDSECPQNTHEQRTMTKLPRNRWNDIPLAVIISPVVASMNSLISLQVGTITIANQ